MRTREKKQTHVKTQIGVNYYPYRAVSPIVVYANWSPAILSDHLCVDDTCAGPPFVRANPLTINHSYNPGYTIGTQGSHWLSGNGLYQYRYRGLYWVSLGTSSPVLSGIALAKSTESMNALGTTGWSKFQPVRPAADLGTMLGESRELPKQLRDAVKALKQLAQHPLKTVRNLSWVADQHLATQFGWLPLMRDLEKGFKAYNDLGSRLDRIKRENGKWVHRGGIVSTDEDNGVTGTKGYISPPPTVLYSMPPEGITYSDVYITSGYRVWFSAWFKYFIQDIDNPWVQLRLKTRIFGLNNTPTIVWNLLPWSWLVDWFSNVGDNISNLCPIDGLVAKKPCIMRRCYTSYTCTVVQRYKEPDGSFTSITATGQKEIETKMRTVASPFGFGLSSDNFSARQWSLLLALGIQRV